MAKPYQIKYYDKVQVKNVEWLWYPYIPYGKITIIQGDPGDGKSTFALNLASIVSNGYEIPFTGKKIPPSNVVYQNSEDGQEDTICPRLKACGANLQRVAYIEETDAALTMDDERLDQVLDETGARVLILDPIQAYFGNGTDMNRASDIRPIMHRLAKMAERRRCAVILIGHMRKGNSANRLYRGLGSIDIPAAARSVLLIARIKEDPDHRIIAHIKSNLAPLGDSVVFKINENSSVAWLRKSRLTAEEVVKESPQPPKGKKNKATDMLTDLLSSGERLATDIMAECRKVGICERTLNKAKAMLGVKSLKKKDGWYWVIERSTEE